MAEPQSPDCPTIRLEPKANARAIRHGAPWVFDNELVMDRRSKAIAPGSIATLEDGERRPLATVAVTLGVGALADRVSARLVLVLSMLLLIAGLLLVTVASPGVLGIAFGALLGASGGAARVVEATELPRYFGTLHIGAIRGVVTALAVAGTALGPVLFAVGHDLTGDYTAVLVASTVLPAAVVMGALFVRLPAHMEPDADGEAHLVRP